MVYSQEFSMCLMCVDQLIPEHGLNSIYTLIIYLFFEILSNSNTNLKAWAIFFQN